MNKKRNPINVPGYTFEVIYPSSIYSLERHEIIPYERFAADVFRESVHELTERHLPPHLMVSFDPENIEYPAWKINCSVRAKTDSAARFIVETPEMLPCILTIFSHIISPHFRSSTFSTMSSELRDDIQKFFDCCSAAVRAYKDHGLATAIRTAYDVSCLDMARFKECVDDYDMLAYLVSNHEIAHIYIDQFAGKDYSPENKKACEYLADLVSVEWMFRRYIYFTPDNPHYREQRAFSNHAHALVENSKWALAGIFNLLILMAVAGAQRSQGRINFEGGDTHPGGFGRSWLQQAWMIGAIEGVLKNSIGDELWPYIPAFWKDASDKIFQSGLITRTSMWQAVDEQEVEIISLAAKIAEDKKIEEILPGLEFLRTRISDAEKMRSKMK
jgi:hypothetical protein